MNVICQAMDSTACSQCQKPKATFQCQSCQTPLCKKCAQFIDQDDFSFLGRMPEGLSSGAYCGPCYSAKVQAAVDSYSRTMAQAEEITVFEKDQGKETRLFSRLEKPVRIENCADRAETVLRLAFLAALQGFNGLIDVDVTYAKVHTGGSHQKHSWHGTGIPLNLDASKLGKRK